MLNILSFVTFVTFVNPPTSKTKDICLDGRNTMITFQSIPTFPPKDDLQISAPDPSPVLPGPVDYKTL